MLNNVFNKEEKLIENPAIFDVTTKTKLVLPGNAIVCFDALKKPSTP